jgi:hypothetical protein
MHRPPFLTFCTLMVAFLGLAPFEGGRAHAVFMSETVIETVIQTEEELAEKLKENFLQYGLRANLFPMYFALGGELGLSLYERLLELGIEGSFWGASTEDGGVFGNDVGLYFRVSPKAFHSVEDRLYIQGRIVRSFPFSSPPPSVLLPDDYWDPFTKLGLHFGAMLDETKFIEFGVEQWRLSLEFPDDDWHPLIPMISIGIRN